MVSVDSCLNGPFQFTGTSRQVEYDFPRYIFNLTFVCFFANFALQLRSEFSGKYNLLLQKRHPNQADDIS